MYTFSVSHQYMCIHTRWLNLFHKIPYHIQQSLYSGVDCCFGEQKPHSLRTIRRLYLNQYMRCERRKQALALPHL